VTNTANLVPMTFLYFLPVLLCKVLRLLMAASLIHNIKKLNSEKKQEALGTRLTSTHVKCYKQVAQFNFLKFKIVGRNLSFHSQPKDNMTRIICHDIGPGLSCGAWDCVQCLIQFRLFR